MSPFLAAALLCGAGLLGLAVVAKERRRSAPRLPAPRPKDSPAAAPVPVTVLLPVRDEEENVLGCLETLLAQTARPAVRVIDDGSTDGTAALAARRAAAEPRLEILPAGPLPAGWRGKLHALEVGALGVDSPWLLLTDADARHHPELLARALAAAIPEGDLAGPGFDAVSVAGFQEARGPGENLLTPPVFALLDVLLGDWQAAAAGTGPAVANGQLILLSRPAWERAGGFAAIRDRPLDDVAIAARLREGGGRTAFFRGPDLLRVRMYRGLAATWNGWRRNLGALLGPRPGTAAAALAVLLLPVAVLVAALAAGRWVEAALVWTGGASASALFRSGGGHAPAWSLLYPLDALLLAGAIAAGTLDHRRGRLASWKGRTMDLGGLGR